MAGIPTYSNFTRSAMDVAETATSVPAHALLEQCGLLPSPPADAVMLDNACGAGIVIVRLLENLDASKRDAVSITCGDIDQTMLDLTSQKMAANGWKVKVERIDAQAVGFEDHHFTHVLMNFGPQLMTDPILALKETYRILRSGGRMGFTCWTEPGWIPSIKEIIPSFNPPTALASPWKDPNAIEGNLASLGFTDIMVSTLNFKTRDENLDSYLELMRLLLPKLLTGETAVAYDDHMREKYRKGDTEMSWQALIVSATKP
ncbi:hypothetical protein ACLMJK_006508 [Lecanora helva]